MTAKMRGSGAGIWRAITNCVLCFALQFPAGTAIAQTVPDKRAGQVPEKWAGQIPDRAALTVPDKPPKFGKEFVVRISYYWPAYGGTNCYPANWIRDSQHPLGGICRSKLLGSPWSDWTGYGAACSPKIKLGDRVYIERIDKVVACVDRGGFAGRDILCGFAYAAPAVDPGLEGQNYPGRLLSKWVLHF